MGTKAGSETLCQTELYAPPSDYRCSSKGTYFIVLLEAGQVAGDCPLMGHSIESVFLRNAEHPLSENQSFRKRDLWNCVPR